MTIKEFAFGEIKKALERLQATVVIILKAVFIAFVNLFFWLLPLMVTGYLLGRPLFMQSEEATRRKPPAISAGVYPSQANDSIPKSAPLALREFLFSAKDFLREIRFLRKS